MSITTFSFTGNTQNSGAIKSRDGDNIALSIDFATGSGAGTVALERKIGGGAWVILDSYTTDTEKNIESISNECAFRCSTTAYSTGTIALNMATPD